MSSICIRGILIVAAAVVALAAAMLDPSRADELGLDRCTTLPNGPARLDCYRKAITPPGQNATPTDLSNGWKLIRAKRPDGADSLAITHTPDTSRSDLDLAGIMLRCADTGVEALVVVLRPIPTRSKTTVRISQGGTEMTFDTVAVPPGNLLLLSADTRGLIDGPWRSGNELTLTVAAEPAPISGVVPIKGIDQAFAALTANCATGQR